jgi:hypothetical protein
MQLAGIPLRALLAGLVLGSFAVILNMLALVMIGMINHKLAPDQRISYFHWGSGIKKQFRTLYPDSKLTIAVRLCEISLVSSFIVLLWTLGIL